MGSKQINLADLFCGAGGTSAGAVEACESLGYQVGLTAINHWDVAIATHTLNHPAARHLCASLDAVNPRDLFREGELFGLWASPECMSHSIARGGRPVNDQSRSTAWCVTRWLDALLPPHFWVENVPEFANWAPIGSNGRPLRSRRGEVFHRWLDVIRALGYKVDYRVLCAADYGDPTTRRRLFVQGVRGRRKIVWPHPTHAPLDKGHTMFGRLRPWVPARAIIDRSLRGTSIFARKRPLSPKTMARIIEGAEKYWPEPFVVALRGTTDDQISRSSRSINEPLATVAASGTHLALVEPLVIPQQSCGTVKPVSQPLPTVSTAGAIGMVEPLVICMEHGGKVQSAAKPLPTITTAKGGAMAIAEPFIVSYYGNGEALSIDQPLDTVTTRDRFGLVRPVIEIDGGRCMIDILFRMLQPHELAGAQGFRRDYRFSGNKTEIVKQIGNAVPRRLARAIVAASIQQDPDVSQLIDDDLDTGEVAA